jgi:hypothetical protein
MTRVKGLILLILMIRFTPALSQVTYLDRPDLLRKVDSCLQHTYRFSFSSATEYQKELQEETPDHPAPYFLHALIVYWKNFPLTPEHDRSDQFIELMDRSVHLAGSYLVSEDTYLEGVFFDLFSRAFKAMYWADNGKATRVVPDLGTMYRHTVEGFGLKEKFSEFYFSSGLYNYYIEAYPDAHPVYKPLVSFMRKGDKELGLVQLNTAIQQTIYLKVESILFMSLIQLHYEEDMNTAALYAEKLYMKYPRNTYYQGHLIMILLHQQRFRNVRKILEKIDHPRNIYAAMVHETATAFLTEKETNDLNLARKEYLRVIERAETIGPFADRFQAIAYMGLARISEKSGESFDALRYRRKASRYTSFNFILNEK